MKRLLALCAFMAAPAYAHDAPTGWSFDILCCSNRDCGEVPDDWVKEKDGSVTIVPTGEVLSRADPKVKMSKDERTYWCRPPGIEPHTICVYLPNKGF